MSNKKDYFLKGIEYLGYELGIIGLSIYKIQDNKAFFLYKKFQYNDSKGKFILTYYVKENEHINYEYIQTVLKTNVYIRPNKKQQLMDKAIYLLETNQEIIDAKEELYKSLLVTDIRDFVIRAKNIKLDYYSYGVFQNIDKNIQVQIDPSGALYYTPRVELVIKKEIHRNSYF